MAVRLKECPAILVRNYVAGVNTYLHGKPAIGKTEMAEAWAEQMKRRVPEFRFWYFYAPTMSPMDIQASAPNYEKNVLQFFNNELLPNAYADPELKGAIFFDEFGLTEPTTGRLLQKYVNGEDVSGILKKPKGVVVIAAGNRLEDKSGVQQQGRALMSRFEHHIVYSEALDNIEHARRQAWHANVQTFFKDHPALIDNYDEVFETSAATRQRGAAARQANGDDQLAEEGRIGIWASMRSWKRVSQKEFAAEQLNTPITPAESAGNVGSGVGAQYEAHKRMLAGLTSLQEIMVSPATARIPEAMDERYALCMVVAMKCTEAQMPQVHTFGARMPLELQAVILRSLAARQKQGFNLGDSDTYLRWTADPVLTHLLNGR